MQIKTVGTSELMWATDDADIALVSIPLVDIYGATAAAAAAAAVALALIFWLYAPFGWSMSRVAYWPGM